MDVAEDGEDKSNIRALSWHFLQKREVGFDKEIFLVSVLHPKWGVYFWTCVKDNITKGKDQYEASGLSGFDYKLFE